MLSVVLAQSLSAQTHDLPESIDTRNLQTGYCPQTHPLEAEPSQKFFLDETIGKRHVRMYLDRGGSGVVGLFFDLAGNWDTTLLGGVRKDGHIDASDATENHPSTGELKASLADNRLTGTWTKTNGDEPEPVDLVPIPEPKCDGREKRKRFDDSDWPVSFSYPASWHLENSGDSVTLTCPNPSEIAYDKQVDIYQGLGSPKGPTNLLHCGSAWKYGPNCDCSHKDSSPGCEQARISRRNSMTILDVSSQEWRIYCHGGGYVASGDGEDRIVMRGDRWLEIIAPGNSSEFLNRLIDTITMRPPHQSK
jgi:hypothetical protein